MALVFVLSSWFNRVGSGEFGVFRKCGASVSAAILSPVDLRGPDQYKYCAGRQARLNKHDGLVIFGH